jgi:hypothetical protein
MKKVANRDTNIDIRVWFFVHSMIRVAPTSKVTLNIECSLF